ncbi:MAG: hypothetical protein K6A94_01770 [Bacteroidales bacterium]|nr:hypothetical protein [Bacteroidales bacterium]
MKTLLFILCIVMVAAFWPYIFALPYAIVKVFYLIVSGRDKDPEWVERKEARRSELASKAEARRGRRKAFWLPSWLR